MCPKCGSMQSRCLDSREERSEAPLDWEAAKEHLDAYEAEYRRLPDGVGLFGLMHICGIRRRYENGERTPELYQDMMAIE